MNLSQHTIATNLNYLLADYKVYLHKLFRYQWRIQALDTPEMSELLNQYSEDVEEQIDRIVGRVMTLNTTPISTLANWVRKSKLQYKTDLKSSDKIIKHVLADSQLLENAAKNLAEQAMEANDSTTAKLASNIKDRNALRVETLLEYTSDRVAVVSQ